MQDASENSGSQTGEDALPRVALAFGLPFAAALGVMLVAQPRQGQARDKAGAGA